MTRRLVFRHAARSDVERHADSFIVAGAFEAADRFQIRFAEILTAIKASPFIGSLGPGSLREFVVRIGNSNYVLRNGVTDTEIVITRLWHGREDRPPR